MPGLDLRSRSRSKKKWPDLDRTRLWPVYYTAIYELLNVILTSTVLVVKAELFCPNLHFVDQIDSLIISNSCCLMIMSDFIDIQEYVDNIEFASSCLRCSMHLVQRYVLTMAPKILSFNLSQVQHMLTLNDTIMATTNQGVKKYKLKGVLYYNEGHFTGQYIGKCGIIWFHNGIGPHSQKLICKGSLVSLSTNLDSQGHMKASATIYVLSY